MHVRSLQIQTDLMLRAFAGEVIDRGTHIVVRTPDNPTFRRGNCLVFPGPPTAEDLAGWRQVFADEIGTPPEVTHLAYTWDALHGQEGATGAFVDAGFKRYELATMTATRLAPPTRPQSPCEIRDLRGDDDWAQWIDLGVARNLALPLDEQEGPGYRAYLHDSSRHCQTMVDAGWGRWFGAFVDEQLVASMGLFVRDGIGRFQSVETRPQFRRRGLATQLLRHVAEEGFAAMGAETLVIVADVDDVAMGIYATAGFAETERIVQIERVDRST